MAHYPPCFAAVRAANKRPPSQPPRKSQRQKRATTTSPGFGGEKKAPVWQCVESCGACCKLDKGPTFPSPEEIFDDPSDIEVYLHSFFAHCVFCVCTLKRFNFYIRGAVIQYARVEEVKEMFIDYLDLRLCIWVVRIWIS